MTGDDQITPEEWARLDPNHEPLFPVEGPDLHVVRPHVRHLPPPTPVPQEDPDTPRLFDLPTPDLQPREVPVRRHVRRNPRRTPKETTMTTIRPDSPRATATTLADLESTAHARRSDPQTSHDAAAQVDLTRRQVQVLDAFQVRYAYDPGRGFTDEEMVQDVQNASRSAGLAKIPSPSGLRTARKALERAGLVEVLTDEAHDGRAVPVVRLTELGNEAQVFVLTEAGRAFVLPDA